ncbi:MAG TPA: transcription elongation factor GreA, partial [Spirochaetes bacterium]|nr:transcription elongation factor GreA [Spirochaetota bacterium]
MSEEAVTDQPAIENELLKNVFEQLTEEKWTRTTIDNYSKRNFILLDEIIKSAEKENIAEDLRLLCIDHLNQSPKSIIALYIAGIITYEQEIIDDSYILQIINLFKENKKWQVLEYLAEKVLTYGESKFALITLEESYSQTENTEELLKTWE